MTTTDAAPSTSSGTAPPPGKPDVRTATVTLPYVTAQVRIPELPVDRLRAMSMEMGHVARGAASFLPPPQRLAYYAGLGALAAFQVIEWPVALAIGAGTAVAARSGVAGLGRPSVGPQVQPRKLATPEPPGTREPPSGTPEPPETPEPPGTPAKRTSGARRRQQPAVP